MTETGLHQLANFWSSPSDPEGTHRGPDFDEDDPAGIVKGVKSAFSNIIDSLAVDFNAALSEPSHSVPTGVHHFKSRALWSQAAPREVVASCDAARLTVVGYTEFPDEDETNPWFAKAQDAAGRWGLYVVRAGNNSASTPEQLSPTGCSAADIDAVAADMIDRGHLISHVEFGERPATSVARHVYSNPASWSLWRGVDSAAAARLAAERLVSFSTRPRDWSSGDAAADARISVPYMKADGLSLVTPPTDTLQACWAGHSSVLLQVGGSTILIDPVWSMKVMSKTRDRVPPFALEQILTVDIVLITHCHEDHLDVPTVQKIARLFKPMFLVPHGLGRFMKSIGITKFEEMLWWEDLFVGDNLNVTFVPAQHWSNRSVRDVNESLWGGWVVKSTTPKISVYHAGDTAYCPAFAEIGHKLGPFDLSFIPIAPIEPQELFASQHATPIEAFKIHRDVMSRKSVPIHWGTFPLGNDMPGAPGRLLERVRKDHNITPQEFSLVPIGKVFQIAPVPEPAIDAQLVPTAPATTPGAPGSTAAPTAAPTAPATAAPADPKVFPAARSPAVAPPPQAFNPRATPVDSDVPNELGSLPPAKVVDPDLF